MQALGFKVRHYKLLAFTLAGAWAGLAGALLANQNLLVSPNLLHWTQSGNLMVMTILGGVGHLFGAVLGAAIMLIIEEVLSAHTQHWQLFLGLILLAVVLVLPKGLSSLFKGKL